MVHRVHGAQPDMTRCRSCRSTVLLCWSTQPTACVRTTKISTGGITGGRALESPPRYSQAPPDLSPRVDPAPSPAPAVIRRADAWPRRHLSGRSARRPSSDRAERLSRSSDEIVTAWPRERSGPTPVRHSTRHPGPENKLFRETRVMIATFLRIALLSERNRWSDARVRLIGVRRGRRTVQ